MPVKRVEKTPMPERDAVLRSRDFGEVNEGYGIAHAQFEAERCLRCQDPVCIDGCPVRVPIPDFVHRVAAGDMRGAAEILRRDQIVVVPERTGPVVGSSRPSRLPRVA